MENCKLNSGTTFFRNTAPKFFFFFGISASDQISEAEILASKYKNTYPTLLDVTHSEDKLNRLIQRHDVVIRWEFFRNC